MTETKVTPGGLNAKGLIGEQTQNLNMGGHKELVQSGTNAFGGGNPQGLYVPMSQDEIEVLHRIRDAEDLELVVGEWGTLHNPKIVIGDHRIRIDFRVYFRGLYIARQIHYFDLELKLGNGMRVYKDRLPTYIPGGGPLEVSEGSYVDMQWDIAIKQMDPDFVRAIKPGAMGLTSRRQDKDTRDFTEQGNMKLDLEQQWLLKKLANGEKAIQRMDLAAKIRASKAGGDKVVRLGDEIHYDHKVK